MSRTTRATVDNAFAVLVRAVELAGITKDVSNYDHVTGKNVKATLTARNLQLQAGSAQYGVAWSVALVGTLGEHYAPPFGIPAMLGWTKAQAALTLRTASDAINGTRGIYEGIIYGSAL